MSDFQTRALHEINCFVADRPQLASFTVLASAVLCSRSTAVAAPAVLDEYAQIRFMNELIQRLISTRTTGRGHLDEGLTAMLDIIASLKPILAFTSMEVYSTGTSQADMVGMQHVRRFLEDLKEQIQSNSFMTLPEAVGEVKNTSVEPVTTRAMSAIEDILAALLPEDEGKDDVDPLRTEWLRFSMLLIMYLTG